jgi:hypothetical protein
MFKKQDFSRCKVNPFWTEEEFLASYPTEKDSLNINAARYFAAMYDPESPLINAIPDYNKRKDVSIQITGYTPDPFFPETANFYLRHFLYDTLWAMIVSHTEAFWEYNQRMMDTTAEVNKAKTGEDMEIINNRLKAMKKQFYSSDDLQKEIEEEKIIVRRTRPEDIAKQLKK